MNLKLGSAVIVNTIAGIGKAKSMGATVKGTTKFVAPLNQNIVKMNVLNQ